MAPCPAIVAPASTVSIAPPVTLTAQFEPVMLIPADMLKLPGPTKSTWELSADMVTLPFSPPPLVI